MDISFTDLSNRNQKLEISLQAFTDLMVVFDQSGKILEYKGGNLPSHSPPDSFPGRKIQEIFPPAETGKFEKALHQVKQTGDVSTFQSSLALSSGASWFDARLSRISQTQFMLTARDITDCLETESRLKHKMQQLSALRSIDLAIASGLDLNLLLSMLLDQVTSLLGVDATAILLLNPKSTILEFAAGKGFISSTLQYTRLKLGEGCAGKVAMERRMINIQNFSESRTGFERSPFFASERFVSYYGVPLIAKGRVHGVLEIFQRSPLDPDADWLNFLKIISGQAAIAIDSATMFRELQISNLELNIAYDATIEGLSRALDLRDKETEEHTRRVADITMRLADTLGIPETDRIHLRRGAMLHDIGKVAIPDQILFKRGPLEEDEWKIMRKHPDIAVQLLSPVTYLTPALEIPHWHHERWDGLGYPDRLYGEQIPFSARLFAFADVYDALTSDRPYRSAWRKQDAIEHIQNQAGKHFDPKIVPAFLELVHSKNL
jgi:putative nucleotidyltransferase with HDIG domain